MCAHACQRTRAWCLLLQCGLFLTRVLLSTPKIKWIVFWSPVHYFSEISNYCNFLQTRKTSITQRDWQCCCPWVHIHSSSIFSKSCCFLILYRETELIFLYNYVLGNNLFLVCNVDSYNSHSGDRYTPSQRTYARVLQITTYSSPIFESYYRRRKVLWLHPSIAKTRSSVDDAVGSSSMQTGLQDHTGTWCRTTPDTTDQRQRHHISRWPHMKLTLPDTRVRERVTKCCLCFLHHSVGWYYQCTGCLAIENWYRSGDKSCHY